jgi:hypothetical protein
LALWVIQTAILHLFWFHAMDVELIPCYLDVVP